MGSAPGMVRYERLKTYILSPTLRSTVARVRAHFWEDVTTTRYGGRHVQHRQRDEALVECRERYVVSPMRDAFTGHRVVCKRQSDFKSYCVRPRRSRITKFCVQQTKIAVSAARPVPNLRYSGPPGAWTESRTSPVISSYLCICKCIVVLQFINVRTTRISRSAAGFWSDLRAV